MGKRRHRKLNALSKRAKIDQQHQDIVDNLKTDESFADDSSNSIASIRIQHKDKVENKVDVIIRDAKNNSYRSLTIWGTGLGVEKTIAVVEELKRNYLKEGTRYSQETSIKAGDNNEPHLQVILTLLNQSSPAS